MSQFDFQNVQDNIIKTVYIYKNSSVNIINIHLQMNSAFQHQTFTLVKFAPQDIVLLHNFNHKLYRYVEVDNPEADQQAHQIIIKAQRLCTGFIYEKELTTLAKQIEPKIQAISKAYFSEAQLNNTFEPILLYLQSGHSYSQLSLQTILIDESGNIRLKDPILNKPSGSSSSQFESLGLVILQCAILKNYEDVHKLDKSKSNLAKILNRFSAKFIANLWVLLNNAPNLLKDVNFSQQSGSEEFRKIVEEIERMRVDSTPAQERKDIFKSVQQKRIVVIPALNLKFDKIKKSEIRIDSGKPYHRNENENEQSMPKPMKKTEVTKKILNFKCQTNKNIEQKFKAKKSQALENSGSPLKKHGKTLDRKIKFQQRSN